MNARRLYAIAVSVGALALLALPGTAGATIDDVFDGAVSCTVEGDGVRFCGSDSPRSTVEAFDGVPIDVNVAFPPEPSTGPDGDFPLVMVFHGYGGGKFGLDTLRRWVDRGYAAFTMTDRGFRESCGSVASQDADPTGCANGYVRLIDNRYEVRDAQEFAGALADEDLIDPTKIGATGGSYGGAISLALAALKDRKVLPDGSLVPWTSPDGKAMRIAAATPFVTWSDLAYSLTPNGGTLDYLADSPYEGPFGVLKQSLVNGLYFNGLAPPASAFYVAEGGDPSADLTGWLKRLSDGEPYDDAAAEAIVDEIVANHSPYYIDPVEPAPLHLANAFTDDLFPVDEMLRYYNRTRTVYPDAEIALFAADMASHPRNQNKPDVQATLRERQDAWLDHYLKGEGPKPDHGVEAYTQTCPSDAAAGGPFRAGNWAKLAPGEIRVLGEGAASIEDGGGSASVSVAFNPATNPPAGGACARTDAADLPGVATYRAKPAPNGGFTLLGSPTVVADFEADGPDSQVAARLLDVAPDGKQTLVARGVWRPPASSASRGNGGSDVFQLHANAYEFEAGHVAKLELLAADGEDTQPFPGGYARPSNDQQPIEVSNLELRLPVAAKPGTAKGLVGQPAPKVLGSGQELAADFAALPDPRAKLAGKKLKVKRGRLIAKVACPKQYDSCNKGKVDVKRTGKGKGFRAAKGKFTVKGGKKKKLKLKLKKGAKRYLRKKRSFRASVKLSTAERVDATKQNARVKR